uniref:Putative DNA binding, helix-turn-helix domain containing protein n=1 Tax=viral metagenome TaxID=1070528 RepID=A0A6M3M2U9_9ZZZZ
MTAEKADSDFLTVPRAAKQIGVHFTTIYRWIEAGKLASVRIGGIVFIPRGEVERLKNKQAGGLNNER